MSQEYNWKAILYGAIPPSMIAAFVFYSNTSRNLQWFYLILTIAAAMGITYYMDKNKQNIFTAPFIVIIVALIIRGLKNLGLI